MAWFVTLASKMTGKEIPGVGKAPGGKIKKDVKEVEEHLNNFVAIAEAMHKANKWNLWNSTPSSRRCTPTSAPWPPTPYSSTNSTSYFHLLFLAINNVGVQACPVIAEPHICKQVCFD